MSESTRPVVLIGGGGHAAVCLEVLRATGRDVRGYLAPEPTALDASHLGGDDLLDSLARDAVELLVAIGSNAVRLGITRDLAGRGFALATAVHPSAVVSPSARLGDGTVLMPGVVVNARTTIGHGVIVNTGATIDHDGSVGDGVHVAPGCHLAGTVTVGEGAFVGVGTAVIPERSVGAWATIGAGSAVVRDIPDGVTAVGVPCRVVPRRV